MHKYPTFLSPKYLNYLLANSQLVPGLESLSQVGEAKGLETIEALKFLCELFELTRHDLHKILSQRKKDQEFIDSRTKILDQFNKQNIYDIKSPSYQTVIGLQDHEGRVVVGPLKETYHSAKNEKPIADIPEFLQGNHVTLFGPSDSTKMSINAMNSYHRVIPNEPKIIAELLQGSKNLPKWGVDNEDSNTPMREKFINSGIHLNGCLEKKISYTDPKSQEKYKLAEDKLAQPIKRFPGLALPCCFLFYKNYPIPLHLYDFALHFFHNWKNPKALAFYVPKLENEEEARYLKHMIEQAENLLKDRHQEYKLGSIRLMIVLENARAVFRVNEIMDELYPYFSGASLGWHDYLASAARLFKEDSNYRIPVKADPNIIVKYIKASHELLKDVVGPRGGIKVGGMYGVIPNNKSIYSFQLSMKGYIRDVIIQMKRGLTGFWVAHPDFIRIGLALVTAWERYINGNKNPLYTLARSLLSPDDYIEVIDFIEGNDLIGLNKNDPGYARSLLVADVKGSNIIANNHPDEIRYNVFQTLQYLTDWLCGNGCVAVPAKIEGTHIRIMDDLATAERSRWEIWHEIYHHRFEREEFIKICFEEMQFIRKNISDDDKEIQVKWNKTTAKWYPVAFNILLKLILDENPVEFATEILLPFTLTNVRKAENPWNEALSIDQEKFNLNRFDKKFVQYFSACGELEFARTIANLAILDLDIVKSKILSFSEEQVIAAASFHGDIGESKESMDSYAILEQSKVYDYKDNHILIQKGQEYLDKFGFKFMVSAKGKTGQSLLTILKERLKNKKQEELENARKAILEITKSRLSKVKNIDFIRNKLNKYQTPGLQACIGVSPGKYQNIFIGNLSNYKDNKDNKVTKNSLFQLASLSKSLGSAFALEYFNKKSISINSSVNSICKEFSIPFQLRSSVNKRWGDEVQIRHLMEHNALNMHYVYGCKDKAPKLKDLLNKNDQHEAIDVINKPGKIFSYSGAGFIVLQYLIEFIEQKPIGEISKDFLSGLGITDITLTPDKKIKKEMACGHKKGVEIPGLRLFFPAFAAGAMGSSAAFFDFLVHLSEAYHNIDGSGPISHDTAVLMLHGRDQGSMKFMGAKMGMGVFIAEAGANKMIVHQGANDGFRALYLYCFSGPNRDEGFVIQSNGDNESVLLISELVQSILTNLDFKGVNLLEFQNKFHYEDLRQEEIVNLGYKKLIFDSFKKNLPELPKGKTIKDILSDVNILRKAKLVAVSNEMFGQANNLQSPYLPIFDPTEFGSQGKIMDSWETSRHNENEFDSAIFELVNPEVIKYVIFCTKFHLGNHFAQAAIEISEHVNGPWVSLMEPITLEGHSKKGIDVSVNSTAAKFVRIVAYPDGGLSRVYLLNSIPNNIDLKFDSKNNSYISPIPVVLKSLSLPVGVVLEDSDLAKNGKIEFVSNQHYGDASHILSAFEPLNMFDGFESARSRGEDHKEEIIIKLGRAGIIDQIIFDFNYFKNNNPNELTIFAYSEGNWVEIVPRNNVKAFAGNKKLYKVKSSVVTEKIKVNIFPDGGFNRIKVLERH